MNINKNLNIAKRAKKDEFYTQLSDIEKELRHYKPHFKDKTVYCNCDDPKSNFFRYFVDNFYNLGLKKVIATHYIPQSRDLFNPPAQKSVKATYDGVMGVKFYHLEQDGDFRSAECIELLKQSDIVVTNPPFSLFREYVDQLMEYDKQFLILGNMNAITCKDIFPLIKENQMWYGPSISNGQIEFEIPDHYPLRSVSRRVDDEGRKFASFGSIRWFTNLEHSKRHGRLVLCEKYSPEEYPTYDNYDAIEVSKTKHIPKDYAGVMGVPVSFMDKFCPEQFEILGVSEQSGRGLSGGLWNINSGVPHPLVNGKRKYSRLFIRSKQT